jgi:hypothetical protein
MMASERVAIQAWAVEHVAELERWPVVRSLAGYLVTVAPTVAGVTTMELAKRQ